MWETAPLMQGAIRMHVRHEASTQAVIGLLGGNSRMQNNSKARQPLSRATMFRRKQFNGRREVETNLVGREDLQKPLEEEGFESDPTSGS